MSAINIPLIMSASGPVPTPPDTLNQTLITNVASTNPDYTANLPASLIEDVSSTDTGALVLIDQARVDIINNITPFGANPFILSQQGAMLGIPQGQTTNNSVYVVFTGLAGYVIPSGFRISDGTNQYILQNGTVIGTNGQSAESYCVAANPGAWAIPAGSVTTIITSVPTGYTLTVTNPQAGISGTGTETVQAYRYRIMIGNRVTAQGTPNFIKSLVLAVQGVSPRLVNILQVAGGWEIIVGGGDPYQVAGAIYLATLDLSTLAGSSTSSRNISVTITSAPDTYNLTYVNPPSQTVTMQISWNTNLPNFTAGVQVNLFGASAIQNYINGIIVGNPINLLEATNIFQSSIASVLSSIYLSSLSFVVSINGVQVSPEAGTSLILSDPESYFLAANGAIVVVQG